MKTFYFTAILLSVVLFSCKTNKITVPQNSASKKSETKTAPSLLSVSKNATRIIGKIVSIDTAYFSAGKESPCSKVPCKAHIMVEEIIEYGSNSAPKLSVGNIFEANFIFTLSATTKDLFPNMQAFYPGLKNGSRFSSDVEGHMRMGSDIPDYFIFGYQVK